MYLLPIKPPTGKVDLREIESIAGNPENVLRDALEKGFEALNSSFANKIAQILCRRDC